jgi:hypothetical protein
VKAWIEIGGALLTLAGVVIGVYGTFLMTKFYHPYSIPGFVVSVIRNAWLTLTGQKEKKALHAEIATKFASITAESRGESLYGIQWVFFGFFLQTVGAVLILADTLVLNLWPHCFGE